MQRRYDRGVMKTPVKALVNDSLRRLRMLRPHKILNPSDCYRDRDCQRDGSDDAIVCLVLLT